MNTLIVDTDYGKFNITGKWCLKKNQKQNL